MSLFAYDSEILSQGFSALCGIDEAGRGPLAGPVFAAALVLPAGFTLPGLNDSKRLSEKKRQALYAQLTANCPYCVAMATVEEIDKLNILQATLLAMQRAYAGLVAQLPEPPDLALVDGNCPPPLPCPVHCVVSGDAKSACIAGASILAKVTRDTYMYALSLEYPQYALEQHKGYGTRLHYQLLQEHGVSPIHRRSFLKRIIGET